MTGERQSSRPLPGQMLGVFLRRRQEGHSMNASTSLPLVQSNLCCCCCCGNQLKVSVQRCHFLGREVDSFLLHNFLGVVLASLWCKDKTVRLPVVCSTAEFLTAAADTDVFVWEPLIAAILAPIFIILKYDCCQTKKTTAGRFFFSVTHETLHILRALTAISSFRLCSRPWTSKRSRWIPYRGLVIYRFLGLSSAHHRDPVTLLTECLMRMLRRWNPAPCDKIRASHDTSATPCPMWTAEEEARHQTDSSFMTLKVVAWVQTSKTKMALIQLNKVFLG